MTQAPRHFPRHWSSPLRLLVVLLAMCLSLPALALEFDQYPGDLGSAKGDLALFQQAFPGTVIALQIDVGMRLSSLPEQDSYSFALAYVWMGADDDASLEANYARLAEQLHFEFEDIVG